MYLTVKEFSEKYNFSLPSIYRWIKKGMDLACKKPIRIDEEKALKWLENR